MKHVFMVLGIVVLVFGITMSASSQGMTGLNETAQAGAKQGTGVIAKIDPKTRTMTIRDFTMSSNSTEPTGSPNEPADQQNADSQKTTKVFKYSEHTNFASTSPEQMNGRMSDLQVGDAVSLQIDDQNNILRIEEVAAQPQNQQ
jgi:Cu/Ag efflux protein CusF